MNEDEEVLRPAQREPEIETYTVDVQCRNCGKSCTIDVPKGVPVSEIACDDCGVPQLRRV